MVPEGSIKLAVTLGEAPRTATIVIDFLVVNCLSAFNGVLGRPPTKDLENSHIHHCLVMKFPTTARTGQV